MALIPYFFEREFRPRRLSDHILGLDLADDILGDALDRSLLQLRRYIRPHRRSLVQDRVGSKIKADKDKFQVNLDVQHFAPDEISVKTANGCITIEGKHEEKQDEHGFVSRQFTRRYMLPDDCNPELVESKLSSDGVLTIMAPKSSAAKNERVVPITHTGPIRRKQDDEDEINGEVEKETKTPQKKQRKR